MKCMLLLILSLCHPIACTLDGFNNFKTQIEGYVIKMANYVQNVNSNASLCDQIVACAHKQYDQCSGVGAKSCLPWFPKVSSCNTSALFSVNASVGFPFSKYSSKNWTNEDLHFICSSALIEPIFVEIQANNNRRFVKTYFGSNTGGVIRCPGQMRTITDGECSDYDPRGRPWYTAAISSSKFVVIIINNGNSMQVNNRFNISQGAIDITLNTLSNQDFILVLSAAADATPLNFSKVVTATAENIKSIRYNLFNTLTPSNSAINYTKAFETAFSLLDASVNSGFKPSCLTLMASFLIFSHEGIPQSNGYYTNVSQLIDSKNSSYNSKIFAFNINSGSQNTTLLKDLACRYYGTTFSINTTQTQSVQLSNMNVYYTFLAEGITATVPIWTEPYIDAWGYGEMVTVSLPVYKYINGIKIVLGVVAIDVLMSQVTTYTSRDVALNALSKTPQCFTSTLNQCQMQSLRNVTNKACGVANCSTTTIVQDCVPLVKTDLFLPAISTDTSICCESPPPPPIIAIVVTISAVVIAIVSGILIKKYCFPNPQKPYEPQQPDPIVSILPVLESSLVNINNIKPLDIDKLPERPQETFMLANVKTFEQKKTDLQILRNKKQENRVNNNESINQKYGWQEPDNQKP